MTAEFLYQWVLASAERVDAVGALNDACLCGLSGALARNYVENETTGEVLGICLVEQAARFAARVKKESGTANLANLANEEGGCK